MYYRVTDIDEIDAASVTSAGAQSTSIAYHKPAFFSGAGSQTLVRADTTRALSRVPVCMYSKGVAPCIWHQIIRVASAVEDHPPVYHHAWSCRPDTLPVSPVVAVDDVRHPSRPPFTQPLGAIYTNLESIADAKRSHWLLDHPDALPLSPVVAVDDVRHPSRPPFTSLRVTERELHKGDDPLIQRPLTHPEVSVTAVH
jgi:hypothetical protein